LLDARLWSAEHESPIARSERQYRRRTERVAVLDRN
jgi:hypothetical protein